MRAGHAAMETFLVMNGYEVVASVDETEQVILDVASGVLTGNAWQPGCRQGSSYCSGRVAAQPNSPLQPSAGVRRGVISAGTCARRG